MRPLQEIEQDIAKRYRLAQDGHSKAWTSNTKEGAEYLAVTSELASDAAHLLAELETLRGRVKRLLTTVEPTTGEPLALHLADSDNDQLLSRLRLVCDQLGIGPAEEVAVQDVDGGLAIDAPVTLSEDDIRVAMAGMKPGGLLRDPQPCDACDPSFGCFAAPSKCCKQPIPVRPAVQPIGVWIDVTIPPQQVVVKDVKLTERSDGGLAVVASAPETVFLVRWQWWGCDESEAGVDSAWRSRAGADGRLGEIGVAIAEARRRSDADPDRQRYGSTAHKHIKEIDPAVTNVDAEYVVEEMVLR